MYKRQVQAIRNTWVHEWGSLIPHRFISVSYTHLDVYKRQAYTTRAMDYLTERFFTLWLASRPDIRTKTLPLLISWDAR